MNAIEKNLVSARGEALAAHLMASAALQAVLMVLPNGQLDALAKISAYLDDTLNRAGPAKGDAEDELNTHMREYARFQVTQALDHIEDTLRKMPEQR